MSLFWVVLGQFRSCVSVRFLEYAILIHVVFIRFKMFLCFRCFLN